MLLWTQSAEASVRVFAGMINSCPLMVFFAIVSIAGLDGILFHRLHCCSYSLPLSTLLFLMAFFDIVYIAVISLTNIYIAFLYGILYCLLPVCSSDNHTEIDYSCLSRGARS